MALVKPATPIAQISGSIGGSVFATTPSGLVLRSKPGIRTLGVTPKSKSNSNHARLVQFWNNSLTDTQRTTWNTAASTLAVRNGNSQRYYASGRSLFLGFNLQQLKWGSVIFPDPPTSNDVGTPTALSITAVSGGGGSIHVTNTADVIDINDEVLFEVTPALAAGVTAAASRLRLIAGGWPPNTTQDITADWIGKFGSLPSGPGQKVFVRMRITNDNTGAWSTTILRHAIFS